MGASQKNTTIFNNPATAFFDPNLVEIVEGVGATLKDLRPVGVVAHVDFSDNLQALNWTSEVVAAMNTALTKVGAAGLVVEDGVLKIPLVAGGGAYLRSEESLLSSVGQKGAIRIVFKKKFAGHPAQPVDFFRLGNVGNDLNKILLRIDLVSAWRVFSTNSVGAGVLINQGFGSSTEDEDELIEVEFNWDFISGDIRLFIGGAQMGATISKINTFDSSNSTIQIGSLTDTDAIEVHSVTVFNAVQHTADYTPFQAITKSVYSKIGPCVEPAGGVQANFISSTILESNGANALRIKIDSKYYYFNGANWVESSDPLIEANTLAELNLNSSTLVRSNGELFLLATSLISDGISRPSVELIEFEYDFRFIPRDVQTCILYGKVVDVSKKPVEGAIISFKSKDHINKDLQIGPGATILTDEFGEYEFELAETETTNIVGQLGVQYLDPIRDVGITDLSEVPTELTDIIVPNKERASIEEAENLAKAQE